MRADTDIVFTTREFGNVTSALLIEISRLSGHRCPGINEGVFGILRTYYITYVVVSRKRNLPPK